MAIVLNSVDPLSLYSFLVLVSTFISCNEVVARFAAVVIHRKEIWTHILAESTRGLTIFHWFSLRRLDFCQRIKPPSQFYAKRDAPEVPGPILESAIPVMSVYIYI